MLFHKHEDNFQTEHTTMGIEDDRSTTLKKVLMALKLERSVWDGLNSLRYNLVSIERKMLYTELGFDVEFMRWTDISIKLGINEENSQSITLKPQSGLNYCRFLKFNNSTTEGSYN